MSTARSSRRSPRSAASALAVAVCVTAALVLAACGQATPGGSGDTPTSLPAVSTGPLRPVTAQAVAPDGALVCPAALESVEGMTVPEKPQGLDGAARLLPERDPSTLVVCAYPTMRLTAATPLTAPFPLSERTVLDRGAASRGGRPADLGVAVERAANARARPWQATRRHTSSVPPTATPSCGWPRRPTPTPAPVARTATSSPATLSGCRWRRPSPVGRRPPDSLATEADSADSTTTAVSPRRGARSSPSAVSTRRARGRPLPSTRPGAPRSSRRCAPCRRDPPTTSARGPVGPRTRGSRWCCSMPPGRPCASPSTPGAAPAVLGTGSSRMTPARSSISSSPGARRSRGRTPTGRCPRRPRPESATGPRP